MDHFDISWRHDLAYSPSVMYSIHTASTDSTCDWNPRYGGAYGTVAYGGLEDFATFMGALPVPQPPFASRRAPKMAPPATNSHSTPLWQRRGAKPPTALLGLGPAIVGPRTPWMRRRIRNIKRKFKKDQA